MARAGQSAGDDDPKSIESRITERTKAILPVHIYGMPCDMDAINAIAKKHKLAVVEDSCQGWLAEYKGRKCGTLGDLGAFSFQNSKHIPAGEGGAVTGMSDELLDRCFAYHNCGRANGTFKGRGLFTRGGNYRMQHFQAALLLQQFDKLVKETEIRRANADYLSAGLAKIPGITPVRLPKNSRAVWHLYPWRYNPEGFNGLSKGQFIRAMGAEGISCGGGYSEQYNDGIFDETINSTGYKRLWSTDRLKAYRESFKGSPGAADCPVECRNAPRTPHSRAPGPTTGPAWRRRPPAGCGARRCRGGDDRSQRPAAIRATRPPAAGRRAAGR